MMTAGMVRLMDKHFQIKKRERLAETWDREHEGQENNNNVFGNIYRNLIEKTQKEYVELFIEVNKEGLEDEFVKRLIENGRFENEAVEQLKTVKFDQFCYEKAEQDLLSNR